jgi:Ni/Fe-hydrogenase 1 B-type cytochrome subunit
VAAFVYVFNFLARLYWGFVGNKYARWPNYFPLQKSQRQEIVEVVKADVLQTQLHGPISTGHNALAGLVYFFTFLAFVAQTITGFALYSSMSNSWLPRMFVWVVPLLFCHVHHHSYLSCLLSRLHRGARHRLLDYRRMEVRTGEA